MDFFNCEGLWKTVDSLGKHSPLELNDDEWKVLIAHKNNCAMCLEEERMMERVYKRPKHFDTMTRDELRKLFVGAHLCDDEDQALFGYERIMNCI